MKEVTLKRINRIVVNYLSLVGLWENKPLNQNNPVVVYFMHNVIMNSSFYQMHNRLDPNMTSMELPVQDINDMPTINIPPSFFHVLVKELYQIYDKLDEITQNQNEEIKQVLIGFIGDEYKFKEYIDMIRNQYREAFYELVRHYNSYNPDYNMIRIKIINDRMMECAELELYDEAAQIRDKIKDIKEKGK